MEIFFIWLKATLRLKKNAHPEKSVKKCFVTVIHFYDLKKY